VITPFADGTKLVQDGFIANLLKIQFPKDENRRYIVAKAVMVTADQLKRDQARLQEAQTAYRVLRGDLTNLPQGMSMGGFGGPPGGYGGPPAGFGGPPAGYGGPPPGYGGPPPGFGGPPPGFVPPGMPGGMPPGMTGMPGGQTADGTPQVQYLDPLTEEDITNDWQAVVLFAVVVDPPADMIPATQPAEEAPAAPAAPAPAQ
jgi:hypothetical protein